MTRRVGNELTGRIATSGRTIAITLRRTTNEIKNAAAALPERPNLSSAPPTVSSNHVPPAPQ